MKTIGADAAKKAAPAEKNGAQTTFTASAKDAEPARVEIDFSNVEERKIEFEVGGGKKNVMACYGSIICHLRRSDSSIGKVWY